MKKIIAFLLVLLLTSSWTIIEKKPCDRHSFIQNGGAPTCGQQSLYISLPFYYRKTP
jgi:hypothetical protein